MQQRDILKQRHVDEEIIAEEHADKADGPDATDLADFLTDTLAAPGCIQLAEVTQQVEHHQRKQAGDHMLLIEVAAVPEHHGRHAGEDHQQVEKAL